MASWLCCVRRRLSRPLAHSDRAQTARGGATVGRRMAGDVWTSSRLAHGREEQCALNDAKPVYRPQSSSARPAGALGEGWVKAQVLTKSLRVRGRLGARMTRAMPRSFAPRFTTPHEINAVCSMARAPIGRRRRLGRTLASPSLQRGPQEASKLRRQAKIGYTQPLSNKSGTAIPI